ncbi:hypothetical protein DDQ50_12695 [Amnibacterium flavum]|uniref:Uncharacterized protein n=2 Tax=Amnibacterium flavum TaxID=2173173 RepID=A0A2V1HSA6_9MICO|nr:hypothetical protein DDQ50_12695 [Amnibacterium flavum]
MVATESPLEGPLDDVVDRVLLERTLAPTFAHQATDVLRMSIRREAAMVLRLTQHLESLGHEVVRNRITPAGSAFSLYTDVFDASESVLYEAKSVADRASSRLAVGQLLDYKRYMSDNVRLSAYLPGRPSGDLPRLFDSTGIGLSYEEGRAISLAFER